MGKFKPKQSVILVIPDLHAPFEHKDAIRFLRHIKEEHKPTMTIQLGDIVDQHTLGRWSPETEAKGSNEELLEARHVMKKLGELFPAMTVTIGNHDVRVLKRFKDMKIPGAFLKDLHDVYGMPSNWKIVDSVTIDNCRFMHGDGFTGKMAAIQAAERYRQSCVIGHVHSYAGVQYSAGPTGTIFGVNSGCLIDEKALAFSYAKNYPHKPCLGVTLIKDGVPFFIPMR